MLHLLISESLRLHRGNGKVGKTHFRFGSLHRPTLCEIGYRYAAVITLESFDVTLLGERFSLHLLALVDSNDLAKIHELGTIERCLQFATFKFVAYRIFISLNISS